MIKLKTDALNKFVRSRGINFTGLATILGFSPSMISKIRRGHNEPTLKFQNKLLEFSGRSWGAFFSHVSQEDMTR